MDRKTYRMERKGGNEKISASSKGRGREDYIRSDQQFAELPHDFNPISEKQLNSSTTISSSLLSLSSLSSSSRNDPSSLIAHNPPLRGLKGPTTFAHNSVAPFYKPGAVPLLSKNLVDYIMDKRKKNNHSSIFSASKDNSNLLVTSEEIQNVIRAQDANSSSNNVCVYYRLLDMLPDTLISSASAPAIALPLNNHSVYVGPKVGPNKASINGFISPTLSPLSIDVPHWFKANNGFFMKGIALCVASQALANFYISANNNKAVKSTYHVLCEVPPAVRPPSVEGVTKLSPGAARFSKNAAFQESIDKSANKPPKAPNTNNDMSQYRKPPLFKYSSQSNPIYWSPFISGSLYSDDCLNEKGTLSASINHTCVVHFPEINRVLRNKMAMTKLFNTSYINKSASGPCDNEGTNVFQLQSFFSELLRKSEAENLGKGYLHRDKLTQTINHPIISQYERHLQEVFQVGNVTQQQSIKNNNTSLFWLDTPGARHPFVPIEYCLSLTPWDLPFDQSSTLREVTDALKRGTTGSLLRDVHDDEDISYVTPVSPIKADHIRQGAKRVKIQYTLLHYNPVTCLAVYEVESCTADEHQIRAIFAHSGAPVVGDLMYNRKVVNAVLMAHNNVLDNEKKLMEIEQRSFDQNLMPLGRMNRLRSINASNSGVTANDIICPSASSLFFPLISSDSRHRSRKTVSESIIAPSPLETVVQPLSLFKNAITNVINKYVTLRRHLRLRFGVNTEDVDEENPTQLVCEITDGIASISTRWAAGVPPNDISVEYINSLNSMPTCEETLMAALQLSQQGTSLRIVCQCFRLIHDVIRKTNDQSAHLQLSQTGNGDMPASLLAAYLVSLSLGPCVALSRLSYPSSKNVHNGLRLQAMELQKKQSDRNSLSPDHVPSDIIQKQIINDKKTAAALKAKEEGRFDNTKLFDNVVISATSKGAITTFAHNGHHLTATSASTLPWTYQLALKLKPVIGIPNIGDTQHIRGIAPPASVLSFNELIHQKKSNSQTETNPSVLRSPVLLSFSDLTENDIFKTMVSMVVGGLGAEEEGGVYFCEKCNVVGHSSRHQCPLLKPTQQDEEHLNSTCDRLLSQLKPLPASTGARTLLRQSKMSGRQLQINDDTCGEPVEDLDFFSGYSSFSNRDENEEHKRDVDITSPTQRPSLMGSRGAANSLSFALGSVSPAGVLAFADEERANEIEGIHKKRNKLYNENETNEQQNNTAALVALSASHVTNTGALRFMDNVERQDRRFESQAARNKELPFLHQRSYAIRKQVNRCSYCFGSHSVVECPKLGLGAISGSNSNGTKNNGDIIIGEDGSERKIVKSFGVASSVGAAVKGNQSRRGAVESFDLKVIAGVTEGIIEGTALFCIRCGSYGHFHEDCSTLPADFGSEAKLSRCTVCLARKAVVSHEPHQCGKSMRPPYRPGLTDNEQYHPCGVLRKYFNEEKKALLNGKGTLSHDYKKKLISKTYHKKEITEKPPTRYRDFANSSMSNSSRLSGSHTLYHEVPDQ